MIHAHVEQNGFNFVNYKKKDYDQIISYQCGLHVMHITGKQ